LLDRGLFHHRNCFHESVALSFVISTGANRISYHAELATSISLAEANKFDRKSGGA
jgi:hypothetical protein